MLCMYENYAKLTAGDFCRVFLSFTATIRTLADNPADAFGHPQIIALAKDR